MTAVDPCMIWSTRRERSEAERLAAETWERRLWKAAAEEDGSSADCPCCPCCCWSWGDTSGSLLELFEERAGVWWRLMLCDESVVDRPWW